MFEDSLSIDKGGRRPLRARIVPLAISLVVHGALVYLLLTATMTIKILPLGKSITNVMIVPPPAPSVPTIIGRGGGRTPGAPGEGGLGREAASPAGRPAPPPPPVTSPRTPASGASKAPTAASGLAAQFERSIGSRFKPGGSSELKIVLGPPGAPAAPPPATRGTPPDFYHSLPGGGVPGGRSLGPGSGRAGGAGSGGQRAAMRIALKGYDLAPWAQKVIDAIQRRWILPNVGKLPAETRIRLAALIKKDGSLESMEILERCSLEVLDQAVLRAIRESLPFPALPADFPGDILECLFEFTYDD